MTAIRLARGMVFAGDYRILRTIGHGGLGTVYEAEQVSAHRVRALKVLHPQFVEDEGIRARFELEARVAARIPSPNVVQVYASGVDEASGSPWMAMELLRGEDLEAAIERRGSFPAAEVLGIFGQLCHALGQAHRLGIVHRDLKPENVFLATSPSAGEAPTVKVLDFGIAKWVNEQRESQANSQLIGTPLWMAPEQAQHSASIRPATDVWALGLIAFRLLTGRSYWRAAGPPPSVAALLSELLNDPLEAASDRAAFFGCRSLVPTGFDGWFSRCVVRDATQRFADAGKALSALEPILGGSSGEAAVEAFAHTMAINLAEPAAPNAIGEASTLVSAGRVPSATSPETLGFASTVVRPAPSGASQARPSAPQGLGAPPRAPFGPPRAPPATPLVAPAGTPPVAPPAVSNPQATTLPIPSMGSASLAPVAASTHPPASTRNNTRLAVGLTVLLGILGILGYVVLR